MNSLYLLAITLLVFVFGYRFYSKLLALTIYRSDSNYSTPTAGDVDNQATMGGHRQLVFGHHFAAITGVSTITGVAIAVIWGWIPAFLWVVVGTAVLAGTFSFGSVWLSYRYPGPAPADPVSALIGSRARSLFTVLALAFVLIMNAAVILVVAQLLVAYPYAALAFWFQIIVALILGHYLRQKHGSEFIFASLLAVLVAILFIWLLGELSFAFTGALNIDVFGRSLVIINSAMVWIALLLVYLYHATRAPIWKLIQPRGYLTAMQTGVAMILFIIGLLILHPPIVAPGFTDVKELPSALPWLFIILTSGALAGFHLLIATGITARQIKRESDVRYIGYGAVLAEGLVALCAIIIFTAGFSNQDEWKQLYSDWDNIHNLKLMMVAFVNGFAHFLQALGLSTDFTRVFAAVVTMGLAITTLEACIRVQKQLLSEIVRGWEIPRLNEEKYQLLLTLGLTAAMAMYNGLGTGGLFFWPLFGLTNQFLALVGFLLLLLLLKHLNRPIAFILVPLTFLLSAVIWGLILQLGDWWNTGNWVLLTISLILLLITFRIMFVALKNLQQREPVDPET